MVTDNRKPCGRLCRQWKGQVSVHRFNRYYNQFWRCLRREYTGNYKCVLLGNTKDLCMNLFSDNRRLEGLI